MEVLDLTASMQGSMVFREPVNLRINGRFEGTLKTRGTLTIGKQAVVQAQITGETILVAGQVAGRVTAQRSLKLASTAVLKGEVWASVLEVEPGAHLEGAVHMGEQAGWMTVGEVAEYLEVEVRIVEQWAREKKIPAVQEASQWRFEKGKIDEWVATQKSS